MNNKELLSITLESLRLPDQKIVQELPREEMKRLNKRLGKESKTSADALKTSDRGFRIRAYFRRLRKTVKN